MKRSLFIAPLIFSCGIKANPEVLKAPEVEIRRIGEHIYVRSLAGDIRVEGFENKRGYWIKSSERALCFDVQRIGGKRAKFCVPPAVQKEPSLDIKEEEDRISLTARGFDAYRLYHLEEGSPLLTSARDFKESIVIQKDYWERCYGITGLKDGVESKMAKLCAKPKKPPHIEEVEGLELRLGKEKAYLIWFYRGDYREFVVFVNGKEVGRTRGFSFELDLPEGEAEYRVKVISTLGFESSGRSIVYKP